MVGLGALEDPTLVGGATDLERLAVEVFAAQGVVLPGLKTRVCPGFY